MELQDRFAERHSQAPLPLDDYSANFQALKLRQLGWTYGEITRAMAVYHGVRATENAWRGRLRNKMGAPARHHRNGTLRRLPPRAA